MRSHGTAIPQVLHCSMCFVSVCTQCVSPPLQARISTATSTGTVMSYLVRTCRFGTMLAQFVICDDDESLLHDI